MVNRCDKIHFPCCKISLQKFVMVNCNIVIIFFILNPYVSVTGRPLYEVKMYVGNLLGKDILYGLKESYVWLIFILALGIGLAFGVRYDSMYFLHA